MDFTENKYCNRIKMLYDLQKMTLVKWVMFFAIIKITIWLCDNLLDIIQKSIK